MNVHSLFALYAKPIDPCGGMTIDVATGPFANGAPLANWLPSSPSSGVPACKQVGGAPGQAPIAVGRNSPVDTCVNVASPSKSMVFFVSQCPPMLSLSVTCQIPPKLTAKPVPVASSTPSAKSVPVGTPSIANVVPTGRPAPARSASG